MKDKLVNNNAASENLFIADLRDYAQIINEVKPNTYNFIFIDSLDNMRISADDMKELRKLYNHSAIISISQSTKDGKMRGSYEIVHDADIAISVQNGIATTTKNRFLEKGRIYEIFKAESPRDLMPRNTIRS
jgi:predicted ATP-dependent serine protease